MKEFTEINISVASNNLFMAIETYLANPNTNNADGVKKLSHQLFVRAKTMAYDKRLKSRCTVPGDISTLFQTTNPVGSPLPDAFTAELWDSYLACWPTSQVDGAQYERFLASLPQLATDYNLELLMPTIEIGADDYAIPLLSIVEEEARVALDFSMRLVENTTPQDEQSSLDAPYIFKLSPDESEAVRLLISQMLRDKTLIPDGLIYSYDKYIERRHNVQITDAVTKQSRVESSAFSYISPENALIRKHTGQLAAKAKSLYLRGDIDAATLLKQTATTVKTLCDRHEAAPPTPDNRNEFLLAVQSSLNETMHNAVIQTPRGWGTKKIIVNFLAVIAVLLTAGLASGVFAYNYHKNHCFWLRPTTATESQLGAFKAVVEKQGIVHS